METEFTSQMIGLCVGFVVGYIIGAIVLYLTKER